MTAAAAAAALYDQLTDVVTLPPPGPPKPRELPAEPKGRVCKRFETQHNIVVLPVEISTILGSELGAPASTPPRSPDSRAAAAAAAAPSTAAAPSGRQQQQMPMGGNPHAHPAHNTGGGGGGGGPPHAPYGAPYGEWRGGGGGGGGGGAPQKPYYSRPHGKPGGGLKAVPCRYFNSGLCTKGDACQFGHFDPTCPPDSMYGTAAGGAGGAAGASATGSGGGGGASSGGAGGAGAGAGAWSGVPPAPAYPPPPPHYGGASTALPADIPPHPDWQGAVPHWAGTGGGGGAGGAAAGASSSSSSGGGGGGGGGVAAQGGAGGAGGYRPVMRGGWAGAGAMMGYPPAEPVPEGGGDATVNKLRGKLEALSGVGEECLTQALQAILAGWDDEDKRVLLGLGTNAIGLTRFKSVLVKRSIRHCHEGGHGGALDSLVEWERALGPWLPTATRPFSRYFEDELCGRVLEVLRCMAASPFTRFRLEGAWYGSAKTDPAAIMLQFCSPHSDSMVQEDLVAEFPESGFQLHTTPQPDNTAYFTHASGLAWTPANHHCWPITFRGRMKAFCLAQTRKPHLDISLGLLGMFLLCNIRPHALIPDTHTHTHASYLAHRQGFRLPSTRGHRGRSRRRPVPRSPRLPRHRVRRSGALHAQCSRNADGRRGVGGMETRSICRSPQQADTHTHCSHTHTGPRRHRPDGVAARAVGLRRVCGAEDHGHVPADGRGGHAS